MSKGRKLYSRKPKGVWEIGPEYEIVRQIGSGTYSSVCEAIVIATGEAVAIKQISGIFDSPVICKRYLREISIMRQMNHPNVIKIRKIIKPKDLETFKELYIVMDYAPSDLRKMIRSPITLEEDQVKLILYNILCGLKYIHSANILHRDLKPDNILIYNDCQVKICDFGLSRSIPDTRKLTQLEYQDSQLHRSSEDSSPALPRSLTKHVVTRWYRAPELILLTENYGKPIDVWSIGCIIGELAQMMSGNISSYLYRNPILKGSSCYPLSPKKESNCNSRASFSSDQLELVLKLTGTPSDQQASFIEDKNTMAYLRSFKVQRHNLLPKRFPYCSSSVLNLMQGMLRFDPKSRITIEEALSHRYFDDIRDLTREKIYTDMITLEFEGGEDLNPEDLRSNFITEIFRYNKPL
jgi:mitogen-activated protein kinase 1/3